MRPASREKGSVCRMVFPGPVSVARNSPSPPNSAFLNPPTSWMSYCTDSSKATMQPVSTRSIWPGWRSNSMKLPPPWMKAVPEVIARSPRVTVFFSSEPEGVAHGRFRDRQDLPGPAQEVPEGQRQDPAHVLLLARRGREVDGGPLARQVRGHARQARWRRGLLLQGVEADVPRRVERQAHPVGHRLPHRKDQEQQSDPPEGLRRRVSQEVRRSI